MGPDLKGVTARRDRAWLIRYLVAPDVLRAKKDPVAVELEQLLRALVQAVLAAAAKAAALAARAPSQPLEAIQRLERPRTGCAQRPRLVTVEGSQARPRARRGEEPALGHAIKTRKLLTNAAETARSGITRT